jgi:hypothetical protein
VVAEFATGVVLGIDFGSSNTTAAVRDRHGFVQELRLSTAGSLPFLVGRTALQAAFTSPEAFEPSPKRRLADREIFLAGSMIAVTKMVAAVFAEVLARASPRLNEPACGVDVNDSPHSQPPRARPGPFSNAAISFCLRDGETA